MKVLLLLIALFVISSESVFSQQLCIPVEQHPYPPLWGDCPHRLEAQNAALFENDVSLVENAQDLEHLLNRGELVTMPMRGRGYRFEALRRVLRPVAAHYLLEVADSAYNVGDEIVIRGTTRTRAEHEWMLRQKEKGVYRFRQAASCETPERCSPHLSGYAFDVRFRDLTPKAIAVIRTKLTNDQERGRIIAIEEKNWAFHIFVKPTEPTLATHPQIPAQEEAMLQEQQGQSAQIGGGRR